MEGIKCLESSYRIITELYVIHLNFSVCHNWERNYSNSRIFKNAPTKLMPNFSKSMKSNLKNNINSGRFSYPYKKASFSYLPLTFGLGRYVIIISKAGKILSLLRT